MHQQVHIAPNGKLAKNAKANIPPKSSGRPVSMFLLGSIELHFKDFHLKVPSPSSQTTTPTIHLN